MLDLRGQRQSLRKFRNFALSIARSGATVNLIWCANEGAQWQSVDDG
jgi:hypothetical protein